MKTGKVLSKKRLDTFFSLSQKKGKYRYVSCDGPNLFQMLTLFIGFNDFSIKRYNN